jgi:SAM-dependent methyltransferase
MTRYDLELFLKLNDEWRDRPLVARPRSFADPDALIQQSRTRADRVVTQIDLAGRKVLEIGCGRGFFVRVLTEEYGCDARGLDVKAYPEWGDDPRFVQADIADPPALGTFDVILSHAVWEHIEHPYAALVRQRELLAPGGVAYLYANLSRGAQASHRYREVYFPWPHLLFTDEVFEAFYTHLGRPPTRAAWVNHLTYAQYADHFRRIGYGIQRMWPSRAWWHEEFYQQHEDVLSRYPKWDLQHDFVHAVLRRDPEPTGPRPEADAALARVAALERRIARMTSSRSWRLTRPLRAFGRSVRGW